MNQKNSQKIVVVGMSGGVDSSLTAALLKEQGYFVIGVYMKNWSEPIKGVEHCPWVTDQLDARRVAASLGIPFYTVNFEKEYKKQVIDSFFTDYSEGRTPNPDILCNQFIKFDAFFRYAQSLGADYIATGHYARVSNGNLYAGRDSKKDQSYFLWAINPEVLSRVMFPLGALTKSEVRKMADERNLLTAKKKDSQGICFIGSADVRSFLRQNLATLPGFQPGGNVLSAQGEVIGVHKGAGYYTIGQRAGVSDITWSDSSNRPVLYVRSIDIQNNTIIVGKDEELYAKGLVASEINWLGAPPKPNTRLKAKIRYGQTAVPCVILDKLGERITVDFESPQRAITPGQSLVLYDDERVIGGAIIDEALTPIKMAQQAFQTA